MGRNHNMVDIKFSNDTPPSEILRWSIEKYYPRIAIASSFSVEDTVIIDMATQIQPNLKIFYINTGFQFKETDNVKEALKKKRNLNLIEYSPLLSIEEQTLKYGPKLYDRNPDVCCKLRKVEPIRRALQEVDAWITGLRRDQATTRQKLEVVELDYKGDGKPLTKINPLTYWTKKEVWNYIQNNKLPYNTLYDQGYMSIGCKPCTRPVQQGEDERTGRWTGKGKTECGIHTFLKTEKSEN
jgi:phosphoadenosine phosphosulfate reductase